MTDYQLILQHLPEWEPGTYREGTWREQSFTGYTIQRILRMHGRSARFLEARALLRRLQEDGLLSESYEPVRTPVIEREGGLNGQTDIFDFIEEEPECRK